MIKSEILSIVEIIRPIDSGSTEPFQCRLEDDLVYAVKGRSALPQGLIAEFCAAHLGRALKLPIPDFTLAKAHPSLLNSFPGKAAQTSLGTGILFASLWKEPAENLTTSLLPSFAADRLARIYVFDHWVQNGDRALTEYGGNVNLLIDLSDRDLVAIDHNLAFLPSYSPTELTIHACRKSWQEASRDLLFVGGIHNAMAEARHMQAALVDALPEEWLEHEPSFPQHLRNVLSRIDRDLFWAELG